MSTISNEKYEAVIGLEVHAQLLTKSKAFAAVSSDYGSAPNTQVTPLCLAHPGTLPVLNENHVNYTIKMGLATNCQIAEKSILHERTISILTSPKGIRSPSTRHRFAMTVISILRLESMKNGSVSPGFIWKRMRVNRFTIKILFIHLST